MTDEITATCECGEVCFTSNERPVVQLVCHCSDCRQATGRAFAEIVFFISEHVEISGSLSVDTFRADSGSETTRESCTVCGSLMFDRSQGFPTLVGVMAERMDEPFEFEAGAHVWTKSKRADVEIPKDALHFAGNFG